MLSFPPSMKELSLGKDQGANRSGLSVMPGSIDLVSGLQDPIKNPDMERWTIWQVNGDAYYYCCNNSNRRRYVGSNPSLSAAEQDSEQYSTAQTNKIRWYV